MKISFPTQSLKLFHDNPNYPALKLRLTGSKNLEQVALNNLFVTSSSQLTDADYRIDFKMSDLVTHLSQQSEQSSMYHNVDVLKYQTDRKSTPLKLRGEWKCEPQSTDVSIEYTYNADALSSAIPLANVNFIAPVDGGVTNHQMNQEATWNKELDRALWKLTRIENSNSGSKIEGHFDLSSGPTKSKRVAVKFSCPGSTLSGLDISLADVKGYKISFVKKQITAGKYFVDGE
ncbi:uncharacterized protein TRIADDRAFT_59406 [Trichoplax adhaerens]|uniref:MHD domain-containing protein n=1 Tax=Trichoplax adhaerens TaxID=10228 RepID=B3S4Z6_TRIAD|nr:hypothetical protein TRIADDRAFT_59406 [Trichoplax adhaerens]EDV22175.1 hypothetical protein TRIADDRAFT_59406 [Trichoplax adhaerens]|eukprot:XP_002115330.1 hypothetical protein TRIADDRAFT_59406 [Trichoplax adhaerens]